MITTQTHEFALIHAGCCGRRSTWDPKVSYFHNGLKDTDANLEHVLEACDVALVEQAAKLKQGEPPPGWAMMAVHVDDCPGVASSQRMVDLIIGGIQDSTSAHTDAGRRSSASISTRTTRKARSLSMSCELDRNRGDGGETPPGPAALRCEAANARRGA